MLSRRTRISAAALTLSAAAAVGLVPASTAAVPSAASSVGAAPTAPTLGAAASKKTKPVTNAVAGTIPADAFDEESGLPADVQIAGRTAVKDPLTPGDHRSADTPAAAPGDLPVIRADLAAADGNALTWSGTVDPARSVTLLALNHDTGRYEVLDTARGSADGDTELAAAAPAGTISNGRATVMVVGTDPFADDLDEPVDDAFENTEGFDFSIMHLTDTQYITEGATSRPSPKERRVWENGYKDTYRWLAKNKDKHKIAFAAHTGDVIENWHPTDPSGPYGTRRAEGEYRFASEAERIADDSGVPHSVIPGNHDNRGGKDTGPDSMFNEHFGPDRYRALEQTDGWRERSAEYHPWKEGDNQNSYNLFTASGRDFIVINLGYDVTDEEADWAHSVLQQYPTRNAIITTHANDKPSKQADGRGDHDSHDGEVIRSRIVEKNPNVALVLSGHEHGVNIAVNRNVGQPGNHVVELLADYQFYTVGSDELGITDVGGYLINRQLRFGASYFRLLQFDLDRGEMSVDTYSPLLDDFGASEHDSAKRYNGKEDDFRVPIQFQDRTTAFSADGFTAA
ncbi:metallophosphoesterase [Helcobacillus massiliensis]|uniref:metallophosphoesterase n=1 Tax=Helcobacillus massiliensis TaxID=521392 RepID=UPI0021A8CE19|nr:metallophosphoesterase [Helcobacillus massiliensis]MCT1558118.1 metallophosphoesterase [Helcobacillus massiliensis]MCT2037179.1 metallophosphoesterase [Helcobacillus massiliensis]MCT2332863.1 metallophosphoesterase [Helcobacillus massiliensis]